MHIGIKKGQHLDINMNQKEVDLTGSDVRHHWILYDGRIDIFLIFLNIQMCVSWDASKHLPRNMNAVTVSAV